MDLKNQLGWTLKVSNIQTVTGTTKLKLWTSILNDTLFQGSNESEWGSNLLYVKKQFSLASGLIT